MWQMLLKGIPEVQGATRPAAAAEMVLVRIAYVADLPTPDEAIRMIEQGGGGSSLPASSVPRGAPSGTSASAPMPSTMSAAPMRPAAPRAVNEAPVRAQMLSPVASSAPPAMKIASFPDLVALAAERRDLQTKAALEADVRLVRFEDGRLEVAMERSAARTLINDLARKLEQWTGRRWAVIVSNEEGQPTLREQALQQRSARERSAEADPRVHEVLAHFPGAKIVEVRHLASDLPDADIPDDDASDASDSDD
jgi:DNA polymerase-3 subunit gamma/tau